VIGDILLQNVYTCLTFCVVPVIRAFRNFVSALVPPARKASQAMGALPFFQLRSWRSCQGMLSGLKCLIDVVRILLCLPFRREI
jgi:hypothetical protein